MAYYAQLRAALSLLANEGVGIFDRINFAIDAAGNCTQLEIHGGNRGAGTHLAVWEALEHWAASPGTAVHVFNSLRLVDMTFEEAFAEMWPAIGPQFAFQTLLEIWGYDLRSAIGEQRSRNASSYAPQSLTQLTNSPQVTLDFLRAAWGAFNPDGALGFPSLDRHLLRLLLHTQHRNVTKRKSLPKRATRKAHAGYHAGAKAVVSAEFLLREVDADDHQLIREARIAQDPSQPTEMLSRALILLRLATAITRRTFQTAGVDNAHIRAWLDPLGPARGLWVGGAPADTIELWEDTKLALEDCDAMAAPASLFDWLQAHPNGLPVLTQAERIAFWGLAA